jgi:acetoin utilization deacetylase AcuC-like enzyme
MRLVHHPGYDLNLGDHVFPSTKFALIRDRLVSSGNFAESDVARPDPATNDELLLVHEPEWVEALTHGTLTMTQIVQLEIPYSQQMVRAFRLMTGGSILAARCALEDGASMNLGGGFHHAFPGHGEGFCALHDVAVAIRVLQEEGRIGRAMVVDLDVHQGNGTAAIFADDASVFTISMHQYNNYPVTKPPSNIDIHLPDGMGDAEYLALLHDVLSIALDVFRPQLLMYVAGSDPYFEDKLGGLKMTMAGMRRRDEMVYSLARARGIPVAATTAGGYAMRLEDTVELHAQTALAGRIR